PAMGRLSGRAGSRQAAPARQQGPAIHTQAAQVKAEIWHLNANRSSAGLLALHHLKQDIPMNEPLSEVIRIRVTPSHAVRLGEAAALSGLSLSNYIRRRLSADDTLQEELTLLRKVVADLGQLRDTRLAAIESAHLLRAMAKPEHLAIAQQTLLQQR